jgi:hypothetical protein
MATEKTQTVWAATYDLLRTLELTTVFGNPRFYRTAVPEPPIRLPLSIDRRRAAEAGRDLLKQLKQFSGDSRYGAQPHASMTS